MTLLAPRIGNDVSYVTQINDEIYFVWQARYLVRFDLRVTLLAPRIGKMEQIILNACNYRTKESYF